MGLLTHDMEFDGTGYGLMITMLAKRVSQEDWQRARATIANAITQDSMEKDLELRLLKEKNEKLQEALRDIANGSVMVDSGGQSNGCWVDIPQRLDREDMMSYAASYAVKPRKETSNE